MAAECSGKARGGQPDGAPAFVGIDVAAGFRAGLSLAAAGDMDLARCAEQPFRARLFAVLGVAADRVRAVRQVHSRTVIVVDGTEPADGPLVEADGMVSDQPDLLLTVTVADCLPIFLADPRTGAFALVHSGWKGTGIVVEALRAMTSAFGSRAADIAAVIGPGIGPCCYAVPIERHERFRAEFGRQAVQRGLDGSFRLDLRAANAALLEREGIGSLAIVGRLHVVQSAAGLVPAGGAGLHPDARVHRGGRLRMGAFEIRPMRPGDKPAMVDIASRIWDGTDYLPFVFDDWLADPDGEFAAATLGGPGRRVRQAVVPRPGPRVARGTAQGPRRDRGRARRGGHPVFPPAPRGPARPRFGAVLHLRLQRAVDRRERAPGIRAPVRVLVQGVGPQARRG